MRSSKSRSRGNKNRNRPSGGNIVNRVFDSSGPDGKVRGTPQQIIDKYNQLHRDAALAGDRVDAENHAQHAEHYTRMLAEAMREIDKQREQQEQQNRDRQAERDRERTERLKAQERASGPSFETGGDGGDSGLVETPEAKGEGGSEGNAPAERSEQGQGGDKPAPKPRRSRAKKPKPDDGGQGGGNGDDGPQGDGSQRQAAE